ncbi:ABC transporter ATP-binding protein [Thalassovita taeanensis]|uniref:Carbohydrate ABC transporter ATP-binding protein, CUT1 family (TC 3.A.1.1.-) n=1 Tax=Thalassovita taeanensis TaxID=657014 RepID=A0A1H9J826_9RHOB|nr:ABC transporter ATP-binding protein [Thalassovita taeanensis]SEQ82889.1 carbohydrate ABC transporter ATP-binding protein, CUT1 family (TC 3.A.1.1.-) [Thalassovita taeanensis]
MSGRSISLHGVCKSWGENQVLKDISLEIPEGSFTALLGPSGCGKSTLLRIIAGLESANSGQVHIGEADMTAAPPDQRNLSMVFQSYALFPHLNVGDNITFGLRTRRVPKAERAAKLEATADLLGLSPYLDRKPAELSGGQQQRVALARAVIADRPVCLMDEPLSNLDAKLRQTMRTELRSLQRQLGFTMVYVTHDQVEAITMADQVVLLNEGRIEQVAAPRDLYECPASPFVARFIGTPPMNILPAMALGPKGAELERLAGCGLLIGIRPEALSPCGHSSLRMRLVAHEYLGADLLLQGDLGAAPLVVRVHSQGWPEATADLPLAVRPDDFHLFDATSGQRVHLASLASFLTDWGVPAAAAGHHAPATPLQPGVDAPFITQKDH